MSGLSGSASMGGWLWLRDVYQVRTLVVLEQKRFRWKDFCLLPPDPIVGFKSRGRAGEGGVMSLNNHNLL